MRVQFTLVRPSFTPGDNPETIVQLLAAANHRCEIVAMDLSLQGTVPANAPVVFDFVTQSDAGTPGSGAYDFTVATGAPPQKTDRGIDEVIQTTFTAFDGSGPTEPTLGAQLCEFSLHEQAYTHWRPPFPLVAKGSERIGLRFKRATFVPVSVTLYCEE